MLELQKEPIHHKTIYWRILIYSLAVIVRLILSPFFIDSFDGPVFFQTGYDIIKAHTGLYYNKTLQTKFNYFPPAYAIVLSGLSLYYLFGVNNVALERLCLKLPLIVGDIFLALLFRNRDHRDHDNRGNIFTQYFSKEELFVLFNPLLIYVSAIKGQFDVYPAIFVVLAWLYFKKHRYVVAGFFATFSFFCKPYTVIFIGFMGLYVLVKQWKKIIPLILGVLCVIIPILIVGYLTNFQGMLYHSFLYHLSREPNGYSLTAMVFYTFLYFSQKFMSKPNAVLLANIWLYINTAALLVVFFVLVYLFWKKVKLEKSRDKEILRFSLLAYFAYYILGKQFLVHYLVTFVIILLLYVRETGRGVKTEELLLAIAIIPLGMIFRVHHMTPVDVQNTLGAYWAIVIWFGGLTLHVILLIYFRIKGYKLFKTRYNKIFYALLVAVIIVAFIIQAYVYDFFYITTKLPV